jgi:hypothetical protein
MAHFKFDKSEVGRKRASEAGKRGGIALLGIPKSQEHRNSMSQARTGFKCSEACKKNMSKARTGLKCSVSRSDESRIKTSKSMIGNLVGEKNPNWRGGIAFEPYGVSFNNVLREQIRQRDKYQCQECNIFQKDLKYKLPVHHIDYDKKSNDSRNLISLCKSCHAKTNFNRDNWIEYYKEKILGGYNG